MKSKSKSTASFTNALALVMALLLAGSATGRAAETQSEKLPGPLFDNLGSLHHPVTTKSKEAQRYFDQGMRLLFGFNHKEAIRSFRSAAYLDPSCAMAYWGVAYAYGPHVNKGMDTNDTVNAWTALQLAREKKANASPTEQAYITALEQRYEPKHKDDRSDLDKAYAAAMRKVAKDYPDDLDAQVLFAESLMDTMPWDYWLRDLSPKPETEEVLATLRYVTGRDPYHPGANHFYIHAVEAGPHPEYGLAEADRLADYAPGAGHLVHMPGHIYMRVGQYHDAVVANQKAVKADRDYIRHCRVFGFYPGMYYPHNIYFLWWAQLFEGDSKGALQTANTAATYARENYCGPAKALEAPRLRHLGWLTLVRFGKWDDVLAIRQPPSTNDFLIDRGLWHFTRGLAFAAKKDAANAQREQEALQTIATSEGAKQLTSPHFAATNMLTVASYWLAGKVAGAKGDNHGMVENLQKAVATEDAIPYMEPAYWPIPSRPTLGAALLQSGDAAAAERVFREDLKRWPRHPWSLLGLEKALRAQGKSESADLVAGEFAKSWQYADVKLSLDWF